MQVRAEYYVDQLMKSANPPRRILDLGCGSGDSIELFRKHGLNIRWIGLDIGHSPEVLARTRKDLDLCTYDGVNTPFANESFDLIYCSQVMEHVRHPELLLKEVCRVLTTDGSFIGSVSYLQPYHSYSLWNFTPYGWVILIEDSGMRVVELRPGIDSIALIIRAFLGNPTEYSRWFAVSPLNMEIDEWGKANNMTIAAINYRKLQFCGTFAFYCEKLGRK
jgi:SAM-dependent methyltransferase